MPPLVQGRRIFHTIPLDGAFLSKALRQQELVPNGTRPRPARTVMCRQPHRRVLVLPWTLQRSWAHPSGVARHTRPRTLQSPGGPRACVWPPRRRRGRVPSRRSEWWDCTSTFSCPPFPKGRSHLCTRCYESETVAGGQAALHLPLYTQVPRRWGRLAFTLGRGPLYTPALALLAHPRPSLRSCSIWRSTSSRASPKTSSSLARRW